ncbi:hypothetical protein [uncultured Fretibacterium sp.]|uniref:hypothetical protein n=1 Tax=uncultured Fretibacterium sp. TaxID=1678694 RepID=UPI0026371C3A|nr:hypothetical protein [uncultured Fretibacterium sp.]
MYFLWKRTPHGTIRMSYDGLFDFVQGFLPARFRLYGLALAAGDDALLTLLMSSSDASRELGLTRSLSALMEPLGMFTSVVWSSRGAPGSDWIETRFTLLRSPWAWMALASSIALIVVAGWVGFFWTAFWGTAAWFVVRGLTFLLTRRKSFLLPQPRIQDGDGRV